MTFSGWPEGRQSQRRLLVPALVLACLVTAGTAQADDPSFGPNDVPTLFFISKSDDKNRVDYGMRLDGRCGPSKDESVFPYWREFEKAPPVRTHSLGMFEYVAYGVAKQRVTGRSTTGAEVEIQLKPVDRLIRITTTRQNNRCSSLVRTKIAGVVAAELLSIHVQLKGPMMVDWVTVKGRDPKTGQPLEERLQH